MRKPSVVFLNRVYPPVRGASGRVLRDLARAFARDGWQVSVITTGAKPGQERDGSIRITRLKSPLRGKTVRSYLRVWLRILWEGLTMPRPDLVISLTDPPLLAVAGDLIARRHRARHIHWCHDLYPDILPALGMELRERPMRFFRNLMRKTLRRADRVVVIGRCMARHVQRLGVESRRITVIPNWPDSELMAPNARTRRPISGRVAFRAAHAHQLPPEARPFEALFQDKDPKFRVLYSGNLGRAHPVQTILEAASILNKSNPEVEFVFVGDGPLFDRLAIERARRGLENLRFLPYQPASRLRELMESGDVHLITMKHEAAGYLVPCKLYASLAVGRPSILIGPNHAETARVIDDYQAGAVVPQGDPQRLAQAILNYRLNSEAWFAAQEGARRAGRVFVPYEAMAAWIARARDAVGLPPSRQRRSVRYAAEDSPPWPSIIRKKAA